LAAGTLASRLRRDILPLSNGWRTEPFGGTPHNHTQHPEISAGKLFIPPLPRNFKIVEVKVFNTRLGLVVVGRCGVPAGKASPPNGSEWRKGDQYFSALSSCTHSEMNQSFESACNAIICPHSSCRYARSEKAEVSVRHPRVSHELRSMECQLAMSFTHA
jgi:hypothetical protein